MSSLARCLVDPEFRDTVGETVRVGARQADWGHMKRAAQTVAHSLASAAEDKTKNYLRRRKMATPGVGAGLEGEAMIKQIGTVICLFACIVPLERPVRSPQQPSDPERDRHRGIGLSLDGVADHLLK